MTFREASAALAGAPTIHLDEPTAPRRPAFAGAAEDNFVPARTTVVASVDEDHSAWLEAARLAATKAEAHIAANPRSVTAQARFAQVAWSAGLKEAACSAAARSLALRVEVSGERPPDADSACIQVSTAILAECGQHEIALARLSELPSMTSARILRAMLLIDLERYEQAADGMRGLESPTASTLRGYLELVQDQPQQAITNLREAIRDGSNDPNTLLYLARAYMKVGANGRALKVARQASRMGPGRKDISLAVIDLMLALDMPGPAKAEIDDIKRRGVVETHDFLVMQARVASASGKRDAALALLRRARTAAATSQEIARVAELDGHVAFARYSSGELTYAELKTTLRRLVRSRPGNVLLTLMFADVANRTSELGALEQAWAELDPERMRRADVLAIRSKMAYLRADFDEALVLTTEWNEIEPAEERCADLVAMLRGQLHEDWAAAADVLIRADAQASKPDYFANEIAYALALAGRPSEAAEYLDRLSPTEFTAKATCGLVKLALGEIEEGTRLYRRAADLADHADRDVQARSLMTLHQALAIRRLGVDRGSGLMRAGALPSVDLPTDWMDRPSFRLLERAARANGWDWPVTV